MTRPPHPALDMAAATMVPIAQRPSKVTHEHLVDPATYQSSNRSLERMLPPTLKSADLTAIADAWAAAVTERRAVILGMGAHPIKVGLSRLIVDLIERGWLGAVAGTGAVGIHDWEMATAGHTSEDVADGLRSGMFGMAAETAEAYWAAVALADREGYGLGQAVGRRLAEAAPEFGRLSVLGAAYEHDVPATLHVTFGADTVHMAPQQDAAALGRAAVRDFGVFAEAVTRLHDGGIYLNLGSAVTLPEVFLKAVNIARNVTGRPHRLVTANLDMVQHYRPAHNVVDRPTQPDGRGYSITGHHEILFPLLYAMVRDRLS